MKILETATGELRYHAIRLLANVPESMVHLRDDYELTEENLNFATIDSALKQCVVENLAHQKVEAITDEMVEFILGIKCNDPYYSVLMIALAARKVKNDSNEGRRLDLVQQLENLIEYILRGETGVIGALVLAFLVMVPENA